MEQAWLMVVTHPTRDGNVLVLVQGDHSGLNSFCVVIRLDQKQTMPQHIQFPQQSTIVGVVVPRA